MPKTSAGILPFRRTAAGIELFLVHPGGPFWARKDNGAWTIAKGEPQTGENELQVAIREFQEETCFVVAGPFLDLGAVRQKGGKTVRGFACEFDCDPAQLRSNMFEIEWPPRSGKRQAFPEVDRANWFEPSVARCKINPAQVQMIEILETLLAK